MIIVVIALGFAANSIYNMIMNNNPSQNTVCVFNKAYLRLDDSLNDVNLNCQSVGNQASRYLILLINPNENLDLIELSTLKNSEDYQLCIYDKIRNQFKKCLSLDGNLLDSKYTNSENILYLNSMNLPTEGETYLTFEFKELSENILSKSYSYEQESDVSYEYQYVCKSVSENCEGSIVHYSFCDPSCQDSRHCCLEKILTTN